MKILFALLAGAAIGVAIKQSKTVHINTMSKIDLSQIPAAQLEELIARGMRGLTRKGIYFH